MTDEIAVQIVNQLTRIADSLEALTREKPKSTTSAGSSTESYKWLVEEWNTQLVPLGIPKLTSINGSRAKKVAARIKEYGKDSLLDCIEEVKKSDFLQGKTKKPWNNFNFDWMILPSNYPKVLEGNYSNSKQEETTGYSTQIPESWAH